VASFEIHGGSFRKGTGQLLFGILTMPKNGGGTEDIQATSLMAVEIATQEKQKKLLGTAGGGLIGMAVLGPLGAIGGMLLGGNSSKITFIALLRDNRNFLASCDTNTFAKLQAIALKNDTEQSLAASRLMPSTPDEAAPLRNHPEPIQSQFSGARQTFEKAGWETIEIPAPVDFECAIVFGWQGLRSVGVGITDEVLNSDNIGKIAKAIRDYNPDGLIVVLGPTLGPDAKKAGKTNQLAVGQFGASTKLIENGIKASLLYQKMKQR
jgi:hypothetical protein